MTRRQLLLRSGLGFGALALKPLLGASLNPLSPKQPPLHATARQVVHLFMNGGPSQVDTFDPKPALARFAGKAMPIHLRTERKTGAAFPSPFVFRRYGESGIEMSEIFPHLSACADELCVVRSMYTDIPNHEPSLLMMNCVSALGSPTGWARKTRTCPALLPSAPAGCPRAAPITGVRRSCRARIRGHTSTPDKRKSIS
jgi:hypothetical protein